MKTLFRTGTMPDRSPWIGSAAEGLLQMNPADRDALLERLKSRLAMAGEISKALAWSHDHDPYLKKFFGDDQGTFWVMWGSLTPFQPTVEGVYKRLSHEDPEFWTEPSNDEQDALDAWGPGMDAVFTLYSEHLNALPPGERPGVIAPMKIPVPVAAAAAPAAAAGPTTTEFIVAGVVVAAIGAAVYTLL